MVNYHTWLVLLLLLLFKFSGAQEGILDTDFGDQGTRRFALVDKSAHGTDMLLLDDGSVILAVNSDISVNGSIRNRGFYIYKITADGNPDNGFGNNGSLYFPNNSNERSYFFSMLLRRFYS